MNILVRRLAVGLSIVVLVAVSGVPVGAGGRATDSAPSAPADNDYVTIRLADAPIASYTGGVPNYARTKPQPGRKLDLNSDAARRYGEYLAAKRQDYKAYLQSNASRAQVIRELAVVANAVVVKRNGVSPQVLAAGPGATVVTPSFLVRPAMNISPALIGAPAAWQRLGGARKAGEGIKIGIIDTGVDVTNPFLSDRGYPDVAEIDACAPFTKPGGKNTSNKVIICRVFASGVAPGAHVSPDDLVVENHGTHVAGTAAGNNNTDGIFVNTNLLIRDLSGIAPRALVGDYNVFPGFGAGFVAFGGSAFSHDIAAALEAAVADGMDVVNMSLGGGVQGPHDLLADATNATVDAGVVAAVAAGNSGPGDSTVESPGSAAGALTAGASTNPHFVGFALVANGSSFNVAIGDFNPYDPAVTAPLANWGNTAATAGPSLATMACSPLSSGAHTGKIVVIDRGACTFSTKIRNAQAAGAVGVLIVNSVAGDPIGMGHDGLAFPTIPAAMAAKGNRLALRSLAASGVTAVADGTDPEEFVTANADILAGFSSRGPSPFTYLIKPDVTAPGVNVLSSVFEERFALFQGTSMATPHVAGAAALLKQLHPDWSPDDIKSALLNTGARVVTDHVNAAVDPGVLARGGGRIDLGAASSTPLVFAPASVSFGFWNGNKDVAGALTVAIRNVSKMTQTCSLDVTGPEIVDDTDGDNMFTVAAGASTTLTLQLNAGRSTQTGSGDYRGDVEINCGTGMPLLRVPWWLRIDREAKP